MNYSNIKTFARAGFKFPFFIAAMVLICLPLRAIEFTYKFNAGDKFRLVSTVTEDIYDDRKLTYKAEIVNRISFEVAEISGEWARVIANFQSAEKNVTQGAASDPFQWSEDYQSEFNQNKLGFIIIDEKYYMPMVRNVPVFPDKELKEGDTWTADGMEVYDFRESYKIEKPYYIPVSVSYKYLGEKSWKDKEYPAFSVSYRVFVEPEAVSGKVYPRRIQRASDVTVYWDSEYGQAAASEEYFRSIFDLSDGQTWEYRGRAETELLEAPPMAKEDMAKDIADEIEEIPDASVRVTDEGIVISLENIQFAPDSSVLQRSEFAKLDLVCEILLKYPDRDIMVGGHTALAGTAAGRLQISRDRAAAVAEYLIGKNVRPRERVVIRGFGSDQPIADNRTAEGMAKNRRVEITILEN